MNAAIARPFAPVDMSLAEIGVDALGDASPARRSRRRADAQIAARKRTDPAYIELRSSDWKAAGELEDLFEAESELEQFNEDEDHWRELDQDDEDEPE